MFSCGAKLLQITVLPQQRCEIRPSPPLLCALVQWGLLGLLGGVSKGDGPTDTYMEVSDWSEMEGGVASRQKCAAIGPQQRDAV